MVDSLQWRIRRRALAHRCPSGRPCGAPDRPSSTPVMWSNERSVCARLKSICDFQFTRRLLLFHVAQRPREFVERVELIIGQIDD